MSGSNARRIRTWTITLVVVAAAQLAAAQPPGRVGSHQKISSTERGFNGLLDDAGSFGFSVASLGDLDGNGVNDLAVGAPKDDDRGPERGAVWILLLGVPCDPCDMNCDGQVNAFDIRPFLDILFHGGVPCDDCTGDTNGDGTINAFDIRPFIDCLFP